jgi:hypothetical protein
MQATVNQLCQGRVSAWDYTEKPFAAIGDDNEHQDAGCERQGELNQRNGLPRGRRLENAARPGGVKIRGERLYFSQLH